MLNNLICLSKHVIVGDPCYPWVGNDVLKLNSVKMGNYVVEVTKSDTGTFGVRCGKVFVVHMDYINPPDDMVKDLNWNKIAILKVDSAQVCITDEEVYRNDAYAESIMVNKSGQWKLGQIYDKEGDKFFDKMAALTLNDKKGWGMYDRGVVVTSGIGDGNYPVYILQYKDKPEILGIAVDFLLGEETEEN